MGLGGGGSFVSETTTSVGRQRNQITPSCLAGNGGNGLCVSLRDPLRGCIGFRQGLGVRDWGNGLWDRLLGITQGLLQGSIPPFPTEHRGDTIASGKKTCLPFGFGSLGLTAFIIGFN